MNRLVQVVPYYNPPHVGGMEIRARERAEHLAEEGWFVETLTSAGRTSPHTVTKQNVVVRYLRSWTVARTPIIISLPSALMSVPKDSVVQVETGIAYVPEVTAFVCRLRKLPYVARVSLDSRGHSRVRELLLAGYQKTVLRWVYRGASLIVVLTERDARLVAEKYHVECSKFRIVPNASSFSPVTTHRSGFGRPFCLLFAGRVAMQKNIPLLLMSLRYFIDTYSLPIRLELVGDGEDMPVVRKLIQELSLEKYISLRGYVTGEQLENFFEASDALVVPSTHETFGHVVLEAMAKALPVVASNIEGLRTVMADGAVGLLADLTKESFAAAFYRLMTEKGLYESFSRRSLEAVSRYSWKATTRSYIDIYEELNNRRFGKASSALSSPVATPGQWW